MSVFLIRQQFFYRSVFTLVPNSYVIRIKHNKTFNVNNQLIIARKQDDCKKA